MELIFFLGELSTLKDIGMAKDIFLTLGHDKKQFEVQIRNQEREHKETLQIMEQEHIQSLKQQSEFNRIAAMPYLLLDKEISVYIEKDILYFALSFFNKEMALQ